ncbi:tat (twin-arginine translocation) pathway signal sequence [Bifidobacterium ramosum]|uniref:DUF362 domain-containing protein n=1 Tax=Bifidobacterium ramosum TaxID=1798158 RepID=A0A6L4X1V4_9BIFI|nr:DUF362 domain-containing protein [Bifidobacterium ramosum]KAB8288738.1 tat (twin-arginine translocation) pathway signal sequence [Bifidobacterium ramosum]NEG71399.1 DUF362 domain-containing protein [Bifidobacterium ramosum]
MVTTYQTDYPMAAKVYFTRDISPAGLMRVYEALNARPQGKVAVKLSSGEGGNKHYLQPALIKDLVHELDGTIVECNTAYPGTRDTSEHHWQTIREHGFTDIAPCDIQDEDGEITIPVEGGTRITGDIVGSHFPNYDYYAVLSHFKGHVMGGFGGALKNISIGMASSNGKRRLHSGGDKILANPFRGEQDAFLEAMAEAATAVFNALKGNMLFINVMNNLSVDCDCDGNPHAPCMHDIGIFSSLDPVAVDQACVDRIYTSDEDNSAMIERIESRHGIHTIEHAVEMGLGSREYQLIDLDQR